MIVKETLLELESVHSSYGGIEALHGVSLTISLGEIVTLIGSNGAGKSTLLMTIFGCPPLTKGRITYQNQSLTNLSTHQIGKRGITLCPEGRRLFPQMTVFENLMMGTLSHQNKSITAQQLEFVYHLFPLLKDRTLQRAGTLSGGEQQMVAIGRGLLAKPTLLLLDEPSLGLAPRIVQQIFHALKEIANQGTTLFLVEQNAHHALQLADRGYVLVNGSITLTGTGAELLNNPDVKNSYLGVD
jgi:branched-chain amino acid transport system ATP-binding protein